MATVDAHGYVPHICIGDTPRGVGCRSGDTYMHEPLFVARLTEMGNAKASKSGTGNGIGTTLYFIMYDYSLSVSGEYLTNSSIAEL